MHGTADTTVELAQTIDVTTRCDQFGVPYQLFAMAQENHFSVVPKLEGSYVDGKNILQHAIGFTYEHLDLETVTGVPLNRTQRLGAGIDASNNQLSFYFPTDSSKTYDVLANTHLDAPTSELDPLSLSDGQNTVLYEDLPPGGNGTLVVALPDLTQDSDTLFFVAEEKTPAPSNSAPTVSSPQPTVLSTGPSEEALLGDAPNASGWEAEMSDPRITELVSVSSTPWEVHLEGLTAGSDYHFQFSM